MKSQCRNWIYNHITCTDNVSEWRRDKSNGIWFSGVLLVHFFEKATTSFFFHLCPAQTAHLKLQRGACLTLRTGVCVFVLYSPKWQLLVWEHPQKTLSAWVSLSCLQPGGSRRTTGGCKTCLWGLLTVPSLRQQARQDCRFLTELCWVELALLLMCLCLWLFPFSFFVSHQCWTSSLSVQPLSGSNSLSTLKANDWWLVATRIQDFKLFQNFIFYIKLETCGFYEQGGCDTHAFWFLSNVLGQTCKNTEPLPCPCYQEHCEIVKFIFRD